MIAARAAGSVVTSDGGEVVGGVSRSALERIPPEERVAPISTVAVHVAVHSGQTLAEGAQVLADAGTDLALILDGARPVGLVTARGILRKYRAAVMGLRGDRPSRNPNSLTS